MTTTNSQQWLLTIIENVNKNVENDFYLNKKGNHSPHFLSTCSMVAGHCHSLLSLLTITSHKYLQHLEGNLIISSKCRAFIVKIS